MKISKTALLILGIGIFVILLASLVWVYLGQRDERVALDDSLSAAEATLTKLTSEKTGLESQLSQLESKLAQAAVLLSTAKLNFPHPTESIEVDEKLFMVADSWHLEVTGLTSSAPTEEVVVGEEDVRGVVYSVTSFTVTIEGEVADILGFTNSLANDAYFNNATVKLVNVNIPEPETRDSGGFVWIPGEDGEDGEWVWEEGEEEKKPSATINLVFYSYQGEGE